MTAAILAAISVILIVGGRRDERQDIRSRAQAYAALTTGPLAAGYGRYFESGRAKFLEIVRQAMGQSPDLERVRIARVDGRVVWDSLALEEVLQPEAGSLLADPDRLSAVRALQPTLIEDLDSDRGRFQVISPIVEDWGPHRLTVLYDFSYAKLRPRVLRRLAASGGFILLAVIASLVLAIVWTGRITRPLEALTQAVRAFGRGELAEPIDVRAEGEVKLLADAFNSMAEELRQTIHQLRTTNQELQAEQRELEAKSAELVRFAYTFSHDLKAPLVTISGFLGLARQDAAAGELEKVRHDLDRAEHAALNMRRLVEDLLELARVGTIDYDTEEVDISEIARESAVILAPELERRRIELVVARRLPVALGDRKRLLEVMQNLIENAIKYMGDQDSPRIEVGAHNDGSTPVFFVRDNGIGIEPAFAERVFAPFTRLDPRTEGTGLGLALVRRIVEQHGGTTWVESAGKGTGSTVFFTLADHAAAARYSPGSTAAPNKR